MYVWGVWDLPQSREGPPPAVSVEVVRVPRVGERVAFVDGMSYQVQEVTQSPRGTSVVVALQEDGLPLVEGDDPHPTDALPVVPPTGTG